MDTHVVVADVSRKPLGVNVNFLLDDDGNRPRAVRTLAEALRLAGVKYLRYPGGEKSDAYLWSVPPFAASVPTLARWASGDWPENMEWPSYDRALVESDGHTFKTDPLSFDEFMTVCRAIDCVPTIVVCYDSMYKPAQPGGVAPTREQLIETAREWVRYANLTKGYGVKYWEIGNESFQDHYNGGTTAENYARDLVDFSRAMKAVDPTIEIGANGQSSPWWQVVLSSASPAIDFLVVHNYPAYGWQGYGDYLSNRSSLISMIDVARAAIVAYAPAVDRDRLTVAVTETGAASWSGSWPDLNDLGHALLLFEIFGQQIRDPLIQFSELWTTRWSGNDITPVPVLWDALDKDNNLQATGQILSLWSEALSGRMVWSTSTDSITSFATLSSSNVLRVMLVNRGFASRHVTLSGLPSPATMHVSSFGGTDPGDLFPALIDLGATTLNDPTASIDVAPVSITVLEFAPPAAPATHGVPGTIQAEDFDEDGYWDATPANEGGEYRATSVDIERTADAGGGYNVGWIAAGEWLEYTVNVQAAGGYTLSLRTASPVNGASIDILVDGRLVQSGLSVPNTGWWQNWATVQTPLALASGVHVIRLATTTGWFNLNWLAIDAATATVSLSGRIEAEDFDEGAYWDATPENAGGEYRATAVDIERCTDAGGGYDVGWIDPGEWLEYTIDIPASGTFSFDLRVASPRSDAAVQLEVDGVPVGTPLAVPDTGWWQTWQTVRSSPVELAAGRHRLRVSTATGWFNLNWISWSD